MIIDSHIHCYDPERPRAKDMWMFGLAQMFSTVSPRMFREYEVDYASPICARFGLVYYGCCDPLDRKLAEVRLLPGVRKVSMSPWVDQELGARQIGADYVFSRKPIPAFLAEDRFDPVRVRADLVTTRGTCPRPWPPAGSGAATPTTSPSLSSPGPRYRPSGGHRSDAPKATGTHEAPPTSGTPCQRRQRRQTGTRSCPDPGPRPGMRLTPPAAATQPVTREWV